MYFIIHSFVIAMYIEIEGGLYYETTEHHEVTLDCYL